MDLEAVTTKWGSACAVLLDFNRLWGDKIRHLQEAVQGTRLLSGLQELQLRYLTCTRHKTLTIWVWSLLLLSAKLCGTAPWRECRG